MKKILSFFFTSFFSHNQTKKFLDYNLLLPFLSSLLMFVYVFFGSFLGYQFSFKNFFHNSNEYHEVLSEVFKEGIEIKSTDRNNINSNRVINTLTSKEDQATFAKYGYDVVMDTRDRNTTYDDFDYYCVLNNDKNIHISYDEYLKLDDSTKLQYSFVVTNRGIYLDTEKNIDKYEAYIIGSGDDLTKYNELKSKYDNQEITKLDYSKELYLIYARLYYPQSIFSLDYYGELPTLRTYYMDHYNRNGVSKKYIYIFQEHMFTVFRSNNTRINYIGYYNSNSNYKVDSTNKDAVINSFILDTFNNGTGQRVTNFMFSTFLIWFIYYVLLVSLSFIYRIVSRNKRYENGLHFANNYKIIGSFSNVSSMLAALVAFGVSFFVSRNIAFFLALGILGAVIIARTILYYQKEFQINREKRINNKGSRFIPQ